MIAPPSNEAGERGFSKSNQMYNIVIGLIVNHYTPGLSFYPAKL